MLHALLVFRWNKIWIYVYMINLNTDFFYPWNCRKVYFSVCFRVLSPHFSLLLCSSAVFHTAQKMKFSIKDFFSKCDQICRKMRIWSHLLRKSLLENFIFCAVSCNHNGLGPDKYWIKIFNYKTFEKLQL